MQRNEKVMERFSTALRRYYTAGWVHAVSETRNALATAMPKRTRYAARIGLGVGAPPPVAPGKPQKTAPNSYGLVTPADTERQMAGARLGPTAVLQSPASYADALVNPNLPEWGSPQQPTPWVPKTLDEAVRKWNGWRYKAA